VSRSRLAALAALGVLLAGCPSTPPSDDPNDDPPNPALDAFFEDRLGHLEDLGVPIVACTTQDDTAWPVFDGCYDWHSAVHGVFALLALHRMTGDPLYAEVADELLNPDDVADELAMVSNGQLEFSEIPYGYAWFLALARERDRGGDTDLMPLAEVVADALNAYLDSPPIWQYALDAPQYDNPSWAALNLWQHYRHVGDDGGAARVEGWIRDEAVPRSDQCLVQDDAEHVSEFFPPCLHLARAIVEILPQAEADAWIDEFLPAELVLEPLTELPNAHPAGLNFSRAWGLWSLYRATGEIQFSDLYVDHVEIHMGQPEYWAENYLSYSHWVPQFGVYAIALSWDDGELVP